MNLFENPVFVVGEYLVVAAFIIHSLNGLRLILQQLGFTLGAPKPPVYPYTYALRRRRPITLAMAAVGAVLLLLVLIEFVV
jgi:succinate dehydrogenase/fumarate reductase cytochrome b subunit